MRFVTKPDKDKTEKLTSDKTYLKLKEIVLNKNKNSITSSIYREPYPTKKGMRSRVEDQFSLSYFNKCAYCEDLCKADIEHFRPKKAVTGEDHDGYYWLCYEWSNLIPSCITCNREGAKHNQFPILGDRQKSPPALIDNELDLEKFKANHTLLASERPYLLHPEADLPDDFFDFDIDVDDMSIILVGKDDDGRGEHTISICQLNRQEVTNARHAQVIDDFIDLLRGLFNKFIGDKDEGYLNTSLKLAFETLVEKSKDDKKSFTLLRKYIVKNSQNFEKIFSPFLIGYPTLLILKVAQNVLD
tara:strand:+ start:8890 stop:9792 length:903 start_codon:yes stop_codon:yes gene_type:complete